MDEIKAILCVRDRPRDSGADRELVLEVRVHEKVLADARALIQWPESPTRHASEASLLNAGTCASRRGPHHLGYAAVHAPLARARRR